MQKNMNDTHIHEPKTTPKTTPADGTHNPFPVAGAAAASAIPSAVLIVNPIG
jgi:hypothetical protein